MPIFTMTRPGNSGVTDFIGLHLASRTFQDKRQDREDSPATVGAEVALQRFPTPGLEVNEPLECVVLVHDTDFILFDVEVAGDVTTGYFAAVGTMAKMATAPCPELCVCNLHLDGTTQTSSREGVAHSVWVMRVGVSSVGGHLSCWWMRDESVMAKGAINNQATQEGGVLCGHFYNSQMM